jgi:hypothetical protein
VHTERDSISFEFMNAEAEDSAAPDRHRESIVAGIKAALLTSRVSLSTSRAGVDPYNSRLGRRPRSAWNGRQR